MHYVSIISLVNNKSYIIAFEIIANVSGSEK